MKGSLLAGKMAQQLRAIAALIGTCFQFPGSIPQTTTLEIRLQPPQAPGLHVVHAYKERQILMHIKT